MQKPIRTLVAASKRRWHIKEVNRRVHFLTFDNVCASDELRALVTADHHWDNAHCDRMLLKRHLEEAAEIDAPVFAFGDTFCAMQGKWDKRADQKQLREEHRGNNYLDLLKKTAGEWYAPHARQIALITPGNHEGSILERHQTDLAQSLVDRMQMEKNSITHLGAYCGFVAFRFRLTGGAKSFVKTLCYHHGYGGGGEVTRGLIDNNRTRGQYHADIFVSGHIHRRNLDENIITELDPQKGVVVQREELFLRASTYKDESAGGWHVEKGRSARPLGAWWLKFRLRHDHKTGNRYIEVNAEMAK